MTVRAIEGPFTIEVKPLRSDTLGWHVPHGRYVVRLEVPGVAPQEQTVTVGSEDESVDFDVP
jgi:hypothetical protein